jgi:hypothetical protein
MSTSRIENLFKEAVDEEKAMIDGAKVQTDRIGKHLIQIQNKILSRAKEACKNEYDWLMQKGQLIQDGIGYKVKLNDNSNNFEANDKMTKFVYCLSKIDYGMKEFFDGVNVNMKSQHSENQMCLDTCVNHEQDKTDGEIKSCMRKCLKTSHENLGKMFNTVETKVEEVLKL